MRMNDFNGKEFLAAVRGGWYRDFLSRVDSLAAKRSYSQEMIEPVRKKYSDLLTAIETGVLGGAILRAVAI